MTHNIILNTDSYKASMYLQYPPKTEGVFSYIESRGGKHDELVFFGLQAFIKEYLLEPITQANIDEADEVWTAHGIPFNRDGWQYILDEHGGYLPLVIKAVPEGMVIPNKNVMLTIENTDPECFWLTTYVETALLRAIWYPVTVATNSREIKKLIAHYLKITGGDLSSIDFKLHDFGARGVTSLESASIGGMAHLINFMGSDTISAVMAARRYYNEPMAAFSIPASEHSTITAWGKDNELDAYRNMLKQFAREGSILAVVSDSYDIYNAVKNIWGDELRQEVIESGATVVIRPDSGNPVDVVKKVMVLLDEQFGSVVNDHGYKTLRNVRVIQGDGIYHEMIHLILGMLEQNGYSADNIAFGMGGALLQAPQRDDQKFAMKASAVKIDGEWVGIAKDPITDTGKKSKSGRLTLVNSYGLGHITPMTVLEKYADKDHIILQKVYEDGKLLIDEDFATIRERAKL